MAHIDYFFGTLSPWAYLAGTRMEAIAARHGASVAYHPFDLVALFPRTGGLAPKDRHPNRLDYRAQELVRWAAHLGMPLNLRPAHWPTNPAPSSYAIIAAGAAARDGAPGDMGVLVHAILRACWAEEQDIAQDDVIRTALVEAGFDPALADKGLWTASGTYEKNLENAVARGVFGAPFYIVAETDQRFWGQDRLDFLDRHLADIGLGGGSVPGESSGGCAPHAADPSDRVWMAPAGKGRLG
jgi:2-hydroxychromene-2-carboxylate isomerase